MTKNELTDEKRTANECSGVTVGYFHRWELHKIPTMDASNAIPELESGNFLPRLYSEVLLRCTACGAGVWMEMARDIDVTDKMSTFFPPKV